MKEEIKVRSWRNKFRGNVNHGAKVLLILAATSMKCNHTQGAIIQMFRISGHKLVAVWLHFPTTATIGFLHHHHYQCTIVLRGP